MKTAAEWIISDGRRLKVFDSEIIEEIQADAFAAGAEAQREADAKLSDLSPEVLAHLPGAVSFESKRIRDNPLVTLPKGET